jgi:hypothetical protein
MTTVSGVSSWSRRVFAICVGLWVAAGMAALPAAAATTTTAPVSMTFNEPKTFDFATGCSVFLEGPGLCGVGNAVPYGHATETILFGGACGGGCDLRTVIVSVGSIYMHENASNPTCKGACASPAALPGGLTLTDVVVGGSGLFAGASGNLSGNVFGEGPQSTVTLTGAITTG